MTGEVKMFSINAKICTLKYNNVQKENIIFVKDKKYIVPIYQRPYEWSEEQVWRFISDLFISFWGITGLSSPEQIFYGTMQLSKENSRKEQEVIDGQQRLSTLLLLFFVLKKIFPKEQEMNGIDFLWLSTRVNSGKQQEYLEKIFSSEFKFSKKGKNKYQINATLIKEYIEDQIKDKEFDPASFIMHLLTNVYFAVIETNAGLSKTLQIFNSINTTGLDLNGADVFKIRMYEYLRDITHQDESAFEKINRLYRLIDDNNEKLGCEESSINEILQIYQYIIIAKYKMPRALYTYGTDTFFEQLFDTILKTNIWEHFKNNVKKIDLSLEVLERIINIRYEWENSKYETVEDGCAEGLINYSRYSRYFILIFIYLFSFYGKDNYFHNLMLFMHKLSKLYTIFSIRYQKVIGEIHTFTYDLIEKILSGNNDKVINFIIEKIGVLDDHKYWYDLEEILNNDIAYNKKLKDIVCRLSAMLHENYHSSLQEHITQINDNIFSGNISIDIEHIQSYKDENDNKREEIWNTWGNDLNSIGNLMILEYDINRSIKNSQYPVKVKKYADSVFQVVHDQLKKYKTWSLADCKKRKRCEVKLILDYLFN
jgi:uncharacterized protein with ParB-like and HNH nuclease domain